MPALNPMLTGVTASLVARDDSSINPKSITLLIFVAIVPVLIAITAVSWLLCCYSRGRGCGRRKSKGSEIKSPPETSQADRQVAAFIRPSPTDTPGWTPNAPNATPSRPVQAHTRNASKASGASGKSGQSMDEKGPTLPKGFV